MAAPGKKLTPTQDLFCRAVVELGSASEAYRSAYNCTTKLNKTVYESASRMMAEPHIIERIAELRHVAAQECAVTVKTIADQLDADRTFARENGTPAAAVSATVAKAKLYGLMETKVNLAVTMRPDEARSLVANLMEKYGGAST